MTKHRSILCVLLALCLLAGVGAMAFTQQARAATVYFSAVNDTLLELSSGSMPAYIGGALYVPYTMFNNNILGVYFSYDRGEQKVSLLHAGRQIYFDMATGETFDVDGNTYSATVTYYNGKIYLPVGFICSFFGFSYSYINSEGLGAIVRVKDGNVVLSDAMFEKAARSLMSERLNKYLGITTPGADVSPSPSEEPDYTKIRIYLGFTGLDGAEAVLDSLAAHRMHAAFFVTETEIREDPDLIRRILCAGHSLGIDLSDGTDYEEASRLLFAAARHRTLLVSGGEEEDIPAGCVHCGYDRDAAAEELDYYALRALAARVQNSLSVHFDCGQDPETVTAFANYLAAEQFRVLSFNEISGGM